jgi:hypothetical protein
MKKLMNKIGVEIGTNILFNAWPYEFKRFITVNCRKKSWSQVNDSTTNVK